MTCQKDYQITVTDPKMLAWWKFSEASGSTNWLDEITGLPLVRGGVGDNGLISEPGIFADGAVTSENADPDSDVLETAGRTQTIAVPLLGDPLTMALWVRITGTLIEDLPLVQWHLYENDVSSNEHILEIAYDFSGQAIGNFRTIGGIIPLLQQYADSDRNLSDGFPHLLVVAYNPVNDKVGISFDGSALLYSPATRVRAWGAFSKVTIPSLDFYGADDQRHYEDLKLWNRLLSNDEIAALVRQTPTACELINNGGSKTVAINGQLISNFSEFFTNSGTAVYYQLMAPPAHGFFIWHPNGEDIGNYTYTPFEDYAGPDSIQLRAFSDDCMTTIETVNITVE